MLVCQSSDTTASNSSGFPALFGSLVSYSRFETSNQVGLQCANGRIGIKRRDQSSIGNQVIDATLANNLGSVDGGFFQGDTLGEVSVEYVEVGAVAQLGGHLLLGAGLVADQTDDQVLGVCRDLVDELELFIGFSRQEE